MKLVKTRTATTAQPWLMLAMKLPSDAASARVRIWRRLNGIGAVPVKNGFYALPNNSECREDFEWLRREIEEAGGEALTLEASLMSGMSDDDMRAAFDAARNEDFDQLIESATELARGGTIAPGQVERLRRVFGRIEAIDFFGASGRVRADALLTSLELGIARETPSQPTDRRGLPSGRIWVTRSDPRIDRLASAWLLRRFVDRNVRFKFVSDPKYKPGEREVRFDMFEAEYTHRGNRCTFEVLLDEAGLKDPALSAVGEIVHDIDIKDGKYRRDEAAGIARMIAGLARRYPDDHERTDRAMILFDDLYASLLPDAA
jgi:hypothetical protein